MILTSLIDCMHTKQFLLVFYVGISFLRSKPAKLPQDSEKLAKISPAAD